MRFINTFLTLFMLAIFSQQNAFASVTNLGFETLAEKNWQVQEDGISEYQMAGQHYMHYLHFGAEYNLKVAIHLYDIAIEKRNSLAMYEMASIYQEGVGVEQDLEKAVDLYIQAIEAGNYYAKWGLNNLCERIFENSTVQNSDLLFLIATMYQHAIGVEENLKKAARFYKRAIETGNTEGAYELAVMHQEGKGVKQNLEEAVRLYNLAAQNGNTNAVYRLALMYHKGNGIEQDVEKAVRLLKLAIKNGNSLAPQYLAQMYYNGDGIDQNFGKAAKFLEVAFEKETISGSSIINLFDLCDEGTDIEQNLQRSKLLFKMGLKRLQQEIEQNDEVALETLCNLYYKSDNHKLVSMVRVVCNSLQGDNSYLWDDELLFLKTTSQLFKFRDVKFDNISEYFSCTQQNDYLNKNFSENGQKHFDFMIKNALQLQGSAFERDCNNQTQEETIKKQLKKAQEYAVDILSYAPSVLNSDNCFIPVSEEIYNLFPCAQWSSSQQNCLKFPLETSTDVGMCFYKICGTHYVTLKQKEIDVCNKLMTALYKPTLRNLEGENLEIITNCFVSIQREFEICLTYDALRKTQNFFNNEAYDDTVKNGFLFN